MLSVRSKGLLVATVSVVSVLVVSVWISNVLVSSESMAVNEVVSDDECMYEGKVMHMRIDYEDKEIYLIGVGEYNGAYMNYKEFRVSEETYREIEPGDDVKVYDVDQKTGYYKIVKQ